MAKRNLDTAQCLEADKLTSRQLQAATGSGQPAVSRQIGSLGDRVIKLPDSRSSKYALIRNAFGSGDKIPLFVVDADCNNTAAAYMTYLRYRYAIHGGDQLTLERI